MVAGEIGTSAPLPKLPPLYNFANRAHGTVQSNYRRRVPQWQRTQIMEQEARARVVRLRKDLQRAADRESAESRQAKAAGAAKAVRTQLDELVGRDISRMLAEVPPADDEEARRMAMLFNKKMEVIPELRGSSWYSLFKQFDDDGSGRVSYQEVSQRQSRQQSARARP